MRPRPRCGPPVPRHPRPGRRSGASAGLLSIAFAPDYPKSQRFYVYYTNNEGNIEIDEFKRGIVDTAPAGGTRRKVIRSSTRRGSNHNGGQLQFGPDGNLCSPAPATVAAAAIRRATRRTRQQPARQADPDRPAPARAPRLRDPADNPFVGRPARDEIYALRAAQPVPLLLRPADRRARDRRRRPGSLSRRSTYESRAAARGANFGWDALRGRSPLRLAGRRRAPRPGEHAADLRLHPQPRRLRDHRRLRGPRHAAAERLRGRYVYADNCDGPCGASCPRTRTAPNDRVLGLASRARARSARAPTGRST